ncbi:unknown [Parabacteroides johnsonii CAG:246]|jgi:hypothetical protein|nr:unknown [Parabacteroides johnsonii CAG:246]
MEIKSVVTVMKTVVFLPLFYDNNYTVMRRTESTAALSIPEGT